MRLVPTVSASAIAAVEIEFIPACLPPLALGAETSTEVSNNQYENGNPSEDQKQPHPVVKQAEASVDRPGYRTIPVFQALSMERRHGH
jgi:hypothetical protein